ncbi:MAG: hypothetical protein QMD13_06905 [Candidatus Bathyarchaeia archaeon]|nr:hypothetical protein [Candidatus Bathyarchaeia archaeon]
MKKLEKIATIVIIFTFVSTLVCITKVQASAENMETFYEGEGYPGLSINVKATKETNPGLDINVTIWIECTAKNLSIEYLYLRVYGFRGGQERILLKNITHIAEKIFLDYGNVSEGNYTVHIPNDVWYRTYTELHFKYAIKETSYGPYTDGFTMTDVKNVYLEELENTLKNLNESYQQLNNTYWELNSTFEQLNQTYWDLHQNYTSLNQTYWDLKGSIGGLDTTKNVAIVLAITTVFFAATTIYLMMRKPKQYW